MNLVFDYDGTIHDSLVVYEPAFRYAMTELESRSLIESTSFSKEQISYWIGFSAKDMWDAFMPELPQELKDECNELIGEKMIELILAGEARLYPQASEVLEHFRKAGHNLIFLSNCSHRYLEAHRKSFPLDELFLSFYCAEDYAWQPKPQIFSSIEADLLNSDSYVIIGDRAMDIAIATTHGHTSIGCKYGYGQEHELDAADHVISELEEIINVMSLIEH